MEKVAIEKILETRLDSKKYVVKVVSDGHGALESMENWNPDLVVLDILMPGMNGYEFLGRLKGDPKTASIPIIILTAQMVEIVKKESQGIGDIPVVQKTEGFKELLKMIDQMV